MRKMFESSKIVFLVFIVALAGLFAFTSCAALQTTESKAKVTVEPSSGKAKAKIAIIGSGFQPGEEVFIILDLGEGRLIGLGTTKVEVVVADGTGAFKAMSNVPRVAKPGKYTITVEGNKGSEATCILEKLKK